MKKRQHYVQRAYLDKFSNDKNQIYIFDKRNNNDYFSNTSRVAMERYFYDIDQFEDINSKQIIEDLLSEMEGKLTPVFNKIIDICNEPRNRYKSLISSTEDRYLMSFYIAVQQLRTRKTRDLFSNMSNEIYNKTFDMVSEIRKAKPELKLSKELKNMFDFFEKEFNDKNNHLSILTDLDFVLSNTQFIYDSDWIFKYNQTEINFITSDYPAIRLPTIQDMPYYVSNKGNIEKHYKKELTPFLTESFSIHYPLNRKISILIIKNGVNNYNKLKRYRNRCIDINNINLINSLNKFMYLISYRYLYSHPDDKNIIYRIPKDKVSANSLMPL